MKKKRKRTKDYPKKQRYKKDSEQIKFKNNIRRLEYEIMMNGRIITEEYMKDNYAKYATKFLNKYNQIHQNTKLFDSSEYVPTVIKIHYQNYSNLIDKGIVGRLEFVEHVTGINKHSSHYFDHHGVIRKFAFQTKYGIDLVELSVFYCESCKVYFDYLESFKLQLKNANIDIETIVATYVDSNGKELYFGNQSIWKEESPLKRFGYTVGYHGLSKNYRQDLLTFFISSGIMSVYDIKKYLNQFIEYNGKKAGNEQAKKDWEEDLLFVNQYIKTNEKDK